MSDINTPAGVLRGGLAEEPPMATFCIARGGPGVIDFFALEGVDTPEAAGLPQEQREVKVVAAFRMTRKDFAELVGPIVQSAR